MKPFGESRTRVYRSVLLASRVTTVFLSVTALHFGQTFFIPIALSLLLSFLLAPAAGTLERRGIPRYPTAVTVVFSSLAALTILGWIVVNESSSLLSSTPRFRENLSRKYSGVVESFQGAVTTFEKTMAPPDTGKRRPSVSAPFTAPAQPLVASAEPAAVISPVTVLSYLGLALAEIVILTLVVAVLSVFLLVHRDEAQERILGLAGESRFIVATRFMNDVVYGVRRYLLLNFVVNLLFGAAFAVVLLLLGVPSPLLWASMAVIFRFIPHIGVYIALITPAVCALSLNTGWFEALTLIAAGVSIDVIVSNFVEPHVYGRGIGVSSIAIVLSALFWTWCWGVIGLLLATPFTVCLAVLGRYVPGLESFSILFGEDTGLRPAYRLYHRLVAGDSASAKRLLKDYEEAEPNGNAVDELVIPAVMFVEADFQQRLLSQQNYRAVLSTVKEIGSAASSGSVSGAQGAAPKIAVCSIRLESEGVVAELLAGRLAARGCEVVVVSEKAVMSEAVSTIREATPSALVVIANSHHSLTGLRYFLKRLSPIQLGIPVVVLALGTSSTVTRVVHGIPLASPVVVAPSLEKVDSALTAFALGCNAETRDAA